MAFDFSYPGTLPSEKGWGPGWPNCQDKQVPLVVRGVPFPGGIRPEVHDLVVMLVEESLDRGYLPKLDNPGCWGGACRDTKRADGTTTGRPSVHSWYLAVDINAPHNVFGGGHAIPNEMGALFKRFGFRWLGPPIEDWMHFDFCGTPADARAMTEKAHEEGLGMALTEGQKEAIADAGAIKNGLEDFLAGREVADLPAGARAARVQTLRSLIRAATLPKAIPGPEGPPAGPHDHDERYARTPHVHGDDVAAV